MFLRVKDGLYAGEVREFAPETAAELLRSGRAVNPFYEIEDAPAPKAQSAPPQVESAPPRVARKKGRP